MSKNLTIVFESPITTWALTGTGRWWISTKAAEGPRLVTRETAKVVALWAHKLILSSSFSCDSCVSREMSYLRLTAMERDRRQNVTFLARAQIIWYDFRKSWICWILHGPPNANTYHETRLPHYYSVLPYFLHRGRLIRLTPSSLSLSSCPHSSPGPLSRGRRPWHKKLAKPRGRLSKRQPCLGVGAVGLCRKWGGLMG